MVIVIARMMTSETAAKIYRYIEVHYKVTMSGFVMTVGEHS
jgi:hypothetical protein